ncbi:high affinity nerve growth factor receptor isoform X1 [Lates japonicus]|uniref:High affinity nerve growth factor receptor isoform X1 n=1 Tax=Lates japonicus TaxID=270547 RepID=A0AAD3NHX1_LATJO|nr:high affinity nerve growth factor receptor isoform X1 [Lates japonicus]
MALAPRALALLLPLVLALLSLAPAPTLGGCPSACRCSYSLLQCLEPDGITGIPILATHESENVTEIYIENQTGLENITEFDLVNYRELKNLTVTSCKLRLISAVASAPVCQLTLSPPSCPHHFTERVRYVDDVVYLKDKRASRTRDGEVAVVR